MSEKRVEGYRHFINKLWNAARFAQMHLERGYPDIRKQNWSLPDRWILSRLDRAIRNTRAALDAYRFNDAAGELYRFIWHELCDWYLEAAKATLQGTYGPASQEASRSVLWRVLTDALIMLHPIIPFVTEEIWHKLPGTEGSIMQAAFPRPPCSRRGSLRRNRGNPNVPADRGHYGHPQHPGGNEPAAVPALAAEVHVTEEDLGRTLEAQRDIVVNLARLKTFGVSAPGERPKASATAVVGGATIYVPLEGVIDFDQEIRRLEKEMKKLTGELTAVSKKLANEDFLQKAPADVVAKVREKSSALLEKQEKAEKHFAADPGDSLKWTFCEIDRRGPGRGYRPGGHHHRFAGGGRCDRPGPPGGQRTPGGGRIGCRPQGFCPPGSADRLDKPFRRRSAGRGRRHPGGGGRHPARLAPGRAYGAQTFYSAFPALPP